MKCRKKGCGGTIINLGWYVGCLSCGRPSNVKRKCKKPRIVIHLGRLDIRIIKIVPDIEAPVKFTPRYVLVSRGEHYLGEKKPEGEENV